jgi:hypothetical protein
MSSKSLRVALLTAVMVLAVAPAHAFRCGTRIITRGDHAEKILKFCGEPTSVTSRLTQRAFIDRFGRVFPGHVEDVVIEEWTFNFGPHQLLRVVRLENGLVADIKYLGYGF